MSCLRGAGCAGRQVGGSKINPQLERSTRHFIYQHFARHAQPPSVSKTAQLLHLSPQQVEAVFQRLHERHALFLEPGTTQIRMANPFSAVPTTFRVICNGRSYWANCAWDMFGIPAALHSQSARIETTCADCGEAIVITLEDGRPAVSDAVVHFAVPFRHWYDDLIFT